VGSSRILVGALHSLAPPSYGPASIKFSPIKLGYLSTVMVIINTPERSVQWTKLYCNILYLQFVLPWDYIT